MDEKWPCLLCQGMGVICTIVVKPVNEITQEERDARIGPSMTVVVTPCPRCMYEVAA